jgi:hypothetical protein
MTKRSRPEYQYSSDLVWAAACTAYRINGGYYKYPEVSAEGKITRPSNRELAKLYLYDQSFITDQDYKYAQRCRDALAQSATMAVLKGLDTEWTAIIARMTSLESVTSDYEIAVITAAPKSYEQELTRVAQEERLHATDGKLLDQLGEVVELCVEPLRSNYSARFHTYYVTAITTANQAVWFAYRSALEAGKKIQIRGRVKRHADRATQLSRVKILQQEVV